MKNGRDGQMAGKCSIVQAKIVICAVYVWYVTI